MPGNQKFLLAAGVIFGTIIIAAPILSIVTMGDIRFTLLNNAGVMIERNGVRIYVDPYDLPDSYADKPADIVCVTHPHGDHYDPTSLDLIQKETTIFIFPENMSAEVALYDATAVNPEDEVSFFGINITAFWSYTLPVGEYPASHPKDAKYCSYIIDVGGFTFFHAGDSKDIPEYSQLEGLVNVALLPLGPGCQTMYQQEVVNAINMIEPEYVIGIHYVEPTNDEFEDGFTRYFEAQYKNIPYFGSTRF